MSSFCFILTEICNWSCEYCDFPRIKDPKHTTIDILSKHLPYIKKIINKMDGHIDFLSVDGGELGLLPFDTLEYFFKTIKYPMVVCTNGAFLESGMHIPLRKYITEVWYHASIDHHKVYTEDFVKTGIVHNDVDELVYFLERVDLCFYYVELEFDISVDRKVSYDMYVDFYKRIKPLPNISLQAKDHIKSRITEMKSLRRMCRDYNSTVVIDFVNERIPRCHRSMNSFVKLNETNLKYRLTHFPSKVYTGHNCGSCTRLFANKFNKNTFEEIYKLRKIL